MVVALLCLDTGRAWQSMCQRQLYGVTVCCYQQAAVVMRSVSLPSGWEPPASSMPRSATYYSDARLLQLSHPEEDVSGFIIFLDHRPASFLPLGWRHEKVHQIIPCSEKWGLGRRVRLR